MTNLFIDQFVTWDEVHRKVIPISDDGYVRTDYKYHIRKFPHDYNGKLDVSNGTYSIEKVTLTKRKYTEEFRLCLGVAVVTPVIDGVEQPQEFRRLNVFVYSWKTLISMTDFENKSQKNRMSEGTERGSHIRVG